MLPLITIDQNISFIFNAQHDCKGRECGYAIDETNAQGGQPATKPDRRMMHSAHDKYFINLHALHNAWRLHEGISPNPCHIFPTVKSFTARWQENFKRPTQQSARGQRRRQRTHANKRKEWLSWRKQPIARTSEVTTKSIRQHDIT